MKKVPIHIVIVLALLPLFTSITNSAIVEQAQGTNTFLPLVFSSPLQIPTIQLPLVRCSCNQRWYFFHLCPVGSW